MKMNVETAENYPSFFYELNEEGSNKWWFNFTRGRNDDGSRVTKEQEALLAGEIYKRLTCHDELVEVLSELMAAEWMVSHDWGGDRSSVLDKADKALLKAEG